MQGTLSYDYLKQHCRNTNQPDELLDYLDDLLKLLSHDNAPFLKAVDRGHGGMYQLNVAFCQSYLQTKIALSVVTEKMGSLSARILRILFDKNFLDEKQVSLFDSVHLEISKLAMASSKEVRSKLFALLKDKYVLLQVQ